MINFLQKSRLVVHGCRDLLGRFRWLVRPSDAAAGESVRNQRRHAHWNRPLRNRQSALPGVPPRAHAQGRCGYGPRLPLLVISPYAKANFVDHTMTDQSSILRFIEDNWLKASVSRVRSTRSQAPSTTCSTSTPRPIRPRSSSRKRAVTGESGANGFTRSGAALHPVNRHRHR